jgi:hypothetical protein
LAAATWQEREEHLSQTYEMLATRQNALGSAEYQEPHTRSYYGRAYQVIHAARFAEALVASIQDIEVKRIVTAVGLVGGLDQFVDSTDILERPWLCQQVGALLLGS